MKALLLPIRPQYMEEILDGKKRYEFRTRLCKDQVDLAILYETSPTMKIVGEATIERKISLEKHVLWELAQEYAGIDHAVYLNYFNRSTIAHAYVFGRVIRYPSPQSLSSVGMLKPPQSFAYIQNTTLLKSLRQNAGLQDL